MATWMRYKNNDNATVIFDLDRATHFRHVAAHDESFIEVYVEGTMHSVMLLTDPEAYREVTRFVAMTTGYELTS